MNARASLVSLILVAAAVGCANKSQPPAAPPPVSEFDKAKAPPIAAKTRFAAGQVAEGQGQYEQAARQYQASLKIEPKYADAMFRLGIVQTVMKDYPAAIATWNQYVTLTNSAAAYGNLGFCEELAGNPGAAEGAYLKGIERDPSGEPCHINYGLMLARHGRPNEGLLQLQAVLPPAKAHYDLASVYEMTGRKKEAKAEYTKALQLDPGLSDAKERLASLSE
ncbi:MAG TPA: tetratricopeptide repeat protein [Tepidisphaeraceae bacterium]|nr:tetratricopeptide repeat protein [Tepidisphaeraceae bacterium]